MNDVRKEAAYAAHRKRLAEKDIGHALVALQNDECEHALWNLLLATVRLKPLVPDSFLEEVEEVIRNEQRKRDRQEQNKIHNVIEPPKSKSKPLLIYSETAQHLDFGPLSQAVANGTQEEIRIALELDALAMTLARRQQSDQRQEGITVGDLCRNSAALISDASDTLERLVEQGKLLPKDADNVYHLPAESNRAKAKRAGQDLGKLVQDRRLEANALEARAMDLALENGCITAIGLRNSSDASLNEARQALERLVDKGLLRPKDGAGIYRLGKLAEAT